MELLQTSLMSLAFSRLELNPFLGPRFSITSRQCSSRVQMIGAGSSAIHSHFCPSESVKRKESPSKSPFSSFKSSSHQLGQASAPSPRCRSSTSVSFILPGTLFSLSVPPGLFLAGVSMWSTKGRVPSQTGHQGQPMHLAHRDKMSLSLASPKFVLENWNIFQKSKVGEEWGRGVPLH